MINMKNFCFGLSLTAIMALLSNLHAHDIKTGLTKWADQPWTLKKWMMAGAIDEDAPVGRCVAHFYNPLGNSQSPDNHFLTDPKEFGCRDSFQWVSTGENFTPGWPIDPPGTNRESWVKARAYYFDALTKASEHEREVRVECLLLNKKPSQARNWDLAVLFFGNS